MLPTDSQVIGAFANASMLDIEKRNSACLQLAQRYTHVVGSVIPWHEAVDRIHNNNRDTPKGVIAEQLLAADDAKKLAVQLHQSGSLVLKVVK
ncbi:hypothetical protein ACIPL1_27375 [Pseudomonas sp. NPDC090202]|uniref:hypothetical protein n=1 Tax=Pseudomonas sp. NPDC090202 TaxID=3364476 RepID=UPI00380C689E